MILDQIAASDKLSDTRTLAFVVMPDHVHWLVVLGARLTLGQVVARLKVKTRAQLSTLGLTWQRDFFEHRLRADETAEDYARYLFLNPYRAQLLPPDTAWPGWWCPEPGFRFMALLNEHGGPPAEWIGEPIPPGLVQAE